MKSIRFLLAAALVAVMSMTACTTAPVDPTSDSTPAVSHFKAQLASGYGVLEVARVGLLNAGQSGAMDVKHVAAAQTQLKAFEKTLDLLRAGGTSPANQTNLQFTLTAISALEVLITASQGALK